MHGQLTSSPSDALILEFRPSEEPGVHRSTKSVDAFTDSPRTVRVQHEGLPMHPSFGTPPFAPPAHALHSLPCAGPDGVEGDSAEDADLTWWSETDSCRADGT